MSFTPSPTIEILRVVSSSEAAALHGRQAKTPMRAGIISGGAVALMWFISALVYLHKRRERSQRAHAAGKHRRDVLPRHMPHVDTKYIIPPDPAWVDPDSDERPSRANGQEEKIREKDKEEDPQKQMVHGGGSRSEMLHRTTSPEAMSPVQPRRPPHETSHETS